MNQINGKYVNNKGDDMTTIKLQSGKTDKELTAKVISESKYVYKLELPDGNIIKKKTKQVEVV